jgi:hypothetical protein
MPGFLPSDGLLIAEEIVLASFDLRRWMDRYWISVPAEPPVPRRYCGEDWWTSLM